MPDTTQSPPRDSATPPRDSTLRIVVDDYDQAQRVRVAKGEQIRAIVQGRDLAPLGYKDTIKNGKVVSTAADALLKSILKGDTDEPSTYLAWAYRKSHEMERYAYKQMSTVLASHPVWLSWMSRVRGVGPTIGAKLLSRLDIDKTHNRSSFAAYCGLSTVPGQRWQCDKCGWVGIFPATYDVTGSHASCKTKARLTHVHHESTPPNGITNDVERAEIRAAQPRAVKGEKRAYDAFAKKTLYLLATSWLKAGRKSYYQSVYRAKVDYYSRERPGWTDGRRHYSALRAAEKQFLSHLYEAWCEALGRDPGRPYAEAHLGHDGIVSASEVLEWEREAAA